MLPLIVFALVLALAIARSPPHRARIAARLLPRARRVDARPRALVIVVAPDRRVRARAAARARARRARLSARSATYVVVYSPRASSSSLLLYPVGGDHRRRAACDFAHAAPPAQVSRSARAPRSPRCPRSSTARARGAAAEGSPASSCRWPSPTFKIAAPLSWTTGALFVARLYGIELHAPQLATIAVASVFISFASPGVPRGAFLMLRRSSTPSASPSKASAS